MSVRFDLYGHERPKVISTILLAVSVVLLLVGAAPIVLRFTVPPPMEYYNVPFPVVSTRIAQGDVVPMYVSRCTVEWLADSDDEVAYVITRNITNAVTGTKIALPQLASNMKANGCETNTLSLAHIIPAEVPPGRYYLEGVAHVIGRWRTADAYWRSQEFEVVEKDKRDVG